MIILQIVYNQYGALKIKWYMTAHIEGNAKNSLNKFFTFENLKHNLLLLLIDIALLHLSAANAHT